MNKPTNETMKRELVGIVNKLHKEAHTTEEPERELAGDLGAVLNHLLFGGRVAVPHRRPLRRY